MLPENGITVNRPILTGAFFMSGVIVLNDNVRRFGELLTPGLFATAVRFLLYGMLLYFVLSFLCRISENGTETGSVQNATKKEFLRYAGLFFTVYLVYLLIFYPGVMYWDTMRQIVDFFDGVTTTPYFAVYDTEITALLNDHDGAFDTVLFGLFIGIGNLFHSPNFGMFLYCLLQAVLFSLLFSSIICEMKRAGCPRWLLVSSVVFYLHPFVCFYAIMMLKDVLFALVFLPYFRVFVRTVADENKKNDPVLLVVFSVLCALTKKPGVYIVAVSNAILLVWYLVSRKKQGTPEKTGKETACITCSVLLPVFLVLILLPKAVFPALQIYPGGKEEVLAVCLQTTVETVREYGDTLTEEDREVIGRVLHYDKLESSYLSHTTDWAKYYFRLDATKEDLEAYLRFFIKTGFRHPLLYLRTVAAVNGGFFSPTETLEIYISADPLGMGDNYPGMGNLSATKTLREDVVRLYDILCETPPFSFFFHVALYTWIIPAGTTLLLAVIKEKKKLLWTVPVGISVLVLIAGPESTTRFATHIIFLAPYLLSLPMRKQAA